MKLSLKKALISTVVVLAGATLIMPSARVFAAPAETPSNELTTEARCEGGALGWVLCPVIKLGQEFVGQVEDVIIDQLDTEPIRTTGRYENLYNAWSGFKNLANVFFIGIFLAIIFAQTLGVGLDNYSIKMMLPRLIIAAIGIQFSFFIMQIGVDISNILGNGIAGLFASFIPAGSSTAADTSVIHAFGALTIVGGAGALAAGTAIVSGLVVPALLLLLAGALALLGVVITVWLRVLLLQFLILLAPLAFVAWVLPNTEKYYKLWSSNVVRLLLMYPIIAFMISAGALATHVTAVTADSSNFAKMLAACIPILIFLMIPAAIKASGMLMAFTGGLIMGNMNRMSRSVRKSGMMQNAKQDLKDRSALTITDNDKNLDRLNTKPKKAAAMLRRGAGRVGSGNAFAFGTVGKRQIYKSTEHARHGLEEDWKTLFRENAFENPTLRDLAIDGLDHKNQGKTDTITDRYGKQHKVKYGHHMAEAAISQLVAQSGFVELSDIVDGGKINNGMARDGKGLFDHDLQMWRNKEIQTTMNRAFGPNAGKVLQKITHAVHLQADRAYGAISASDFANLGAGSGIVAAREGRKWGATNMLNAMLNVSNSNNLASSIQNDVAAAMKRELVSAALDGKFDDISIETRDGDFTALEWLNKYVADSGHVTYLSGDIRRDGIDAAIRKEEQEQESMLEELERRRAEFKEHGPADNH